jgi:tktA
MKKNIMKDNDYNYKIEKIKEYAKSLRINILNMVYNAKSGHIGGSMSIADILSVIMQDFDVKKDEIIFSKGHASPALYSALYLNKIITKKEIDGFRKVNGTLEGHPSIHTKGIKVATGSLGQGLSVGLRNGTSEKNYLKKREKYMLL